MIYKHNSPIVARNSFIPVQRFPIQPFMRYVLEHVKRMHVFLPLAPRQVCVCADDQTPEECLLVQQMGASRAAAEFQNRSWRRSVIEVEDGGEA
jgi:hypothetical protein